MGARRLFHNDRVGAVPDGDRGCLAGGLCEFFEVGQGGTADAEFGQQRSCQADHPESEAVSPGVFVALHVSGFVQTGEHPGDGALVQADKFGDLRDAQEGSISDREGFEDRQAVEQRCCRPLRFVGGGLWLQHEFSLFGR
jgi:hypothetical protein